jgi:hypothetical protein
MLSSNTLLLNLILLIDVTFSTPTPVNNGDRQAGRNLFFSPHLGGTTLQRCDDGLFLNSGLSRWGDSLSENALPPLAPADIIFDATTQALRPEMLQSGRKPQSLISEWPCPNSHWFFPCCFASR